MPLLNLDCGIGNDDVVARSLKMLSNREVRRLGERICQFCFVTLCGVTVTFPHG